MNQNYPQQPFPPDGEHTAFYDTEAFPLPDILSPELPQYQASRPQMIPNIPGLSAEEIQYLLILREAPGCENHFGLGRQHTIPGMAMKLTEEFGHKTQYNPYTLSRIWDLYIARPEPQKDLAFDERPQSLFASTVPQTHIEAQLAQDQFLAASLDAYSTQNSYSSFYEGSQTYHGQQHGQSNPSPVVNHYGPPQSTSHTFSMGRPRPDVQYGGRHASPGASFPFSPNSYQKPPVIASHAPIPNQPSYDQGGGFAMMLGMNQGLAPHGADYGDPTIQPRIRNHEVVVDPRNLEQQHQLIQAQGNGQPMRAGNLAVGEYDQDWHGGYESSGDLSGGLDVPTAEEVENDLRNIFHYRGC